MRERGKSCRRAEGEDPSAAPRARHFPRPAAGWGWGRQGGVEAGGPPHLLGPLKGPQPPGDPSRGLAPQRPLALSRVPVPGAAGPEPPSGVAGGAGQGRVRPLPSEVAGGPPPPAETELSEFGREVLESPGPGLAQPLLVGSTGSDVCSARPASRAPVHKGFEARDRRPLGSEVWCESSGLGVRHRGAGTSGGAGRVSKSAPLLCPSRARPPPPSPRRPSPSLGASLAAARAPLSGPVDRPPRCRRIRGRTEGLPGEEVLGRSL